jgi:glutaredoxin
MKYLLLLVFAYAVHNAYNTSYSDAQLGSTAHEIDPKCEVVLFTTSSCAYCKKAKKLLQNSGAKWCEKNINSSQQNRQVFESLGAKGVPVMVTDNAVVMGFNKDRYLIEINRI